jgi:hypothetical protein
MGFFGFLMIPWGVFGVQSKIMVVDMPKLNMNPPLLGEEMFRYNLFNIPVTPLSCDDGQDSAIWEPHEYKAMREEYVPPPVAKQECHSRVTMPELTEIRESMQKDYKRGRRTMKAGH